MGKFTWDRLMNMVENGGAFVGKANSGLAQTRLLMAKRSLTRTVKYSVSALGLALALIASTSRDSWVTRSPIFNFLGSAGSVLILLLCIAGGGIWWLITGSKGICVWAKSLMPFCPQPYRAAIGIAALFLIIASNIPVLPWSDRFERRHMTIIHLSVWGIVGYAWIVAIIGMSVNGFPSLVK
jgi:hypothetical protein